MVGEVKERRRGKGREGSAGERRETTGSRRQPRRIAGSSARALFAQLSPPAGSHSPARSRQCGSCRRLSACCTRAPSPFRRPPRTLQTLV
eukprot:133672-Hanusia_phi.AAC.1